MCSFSRISGMVAAGCTLPFSYGELGAASGERHFPRWDFHFRMQPRVERVEDFDGPFQRDSVVLVALVSRHLQFVDAQPSGNFALRYPLGNALGDRQVTEPAEIFEFLEFAALQAFVALDFFLQLKVKRFHRVDDALDLRIAETGRLKP